MEEPRFPGPMNAIVSVRPPSASTLTLAPEKIVGVTLSQFNRSWPKVAITLQSSGLRVSPRGPLSVEDWATEEPAIKQIAADDAIRRTIASLFGNRRLLGLRQRCKDSSPP